MQSMETGVAASGALEADTLSALAADCSSSGRVSRCVCQ